MKSAFLKDCFRCIRNSLGRFLALMGIVALGVGFYAGLRMTAPDMELAADRYCDGTNLYDIRVLSTLGFSEDDVAALAWLDGVEAIMPAYQTDVLAQANGEQTAIRVHSLCESAASSYSENAYSVTSEDVNYLNRLILVSGTWPTSANECVVSADSPNVVLSVGDTIYVTEASTNLEDVLTCTEYTVVGTVHASNYLTSTSMGQTSLGAGTIRQCMYVLDSAFNADYPTTEVYMQVSGAKDLLSMSDEYFDCVSRVSDEVDNLGATQAPAHTAQLQAEYQEELDEKWEEYEEAKNEAQEQLDTAQSELESASASLASAKAQLAQSEQQYNDGATQLAQARATANDQFAQAEAKLQESEQALSATRAQLDAALATLNASWAQAGITYEQAVELAKAGMTTPELDALIASQEQYNQAQASYANAKAQFDESAATYTAQKEATNTQLSEKQAQLDAACTQIEQARTQISQAETSYSAGLEEYESSKAQANDELDDAYQELTSAQEEIDSLETCEWYTLDRSKNYGTQSFKSDGQRVDNIAKVFPLIFFLVAALVALTTMTRLVEEDRVLIGTYKALGYSKFKICSKYILYVLLAAGLGSALGIITLSKLLPAVIQNAYAIMYIVEPGPFPINAYFACVSAAMGIGITLFATICALMASLREVPASLMRPKAPKPGKRIFLERIKPVWGALSFTKKVTCRNIFLYKSRLLMTVIGIAGCTALLLTGLGLRDAINDILDIQYGDIQNYNATLSVDTNATSEERAQLDTLLANKDEVEAYTWYGTQNYSVVNENEDGKTYSVTIDVAQDAHEFESMYQIRSRTSGKAYSLETNGVFISEKLANKLGLEQGNYLTIYEQDEMGNMLNANYTVQIAGVVENYIGNILYCSHAYYAQAFNKDISFENAFITTVDDTNVQASLSSKISACECVETFGYVDEVISTYRTMLKSIDLIVWVLVVSAAALAFIVLYNLTNINIAERAREIATLKVLGFRRGEVYSYIFREIFLLSLLGAALGLVLGIGMEGFVVSTAEVDQVMFGRNIHAVSFVIAFALTLLFSTIVMLLMRKKLNCIDMVSSLKSNE